MKIIVQKYGGSIINSSDDINKIVNCAIREKQNGNKVIIVVSAMKNFTDNLISHAKNCFYGSDLTSLSCYDFLTSSGEYITAGLFALALKNHKIKSEALSAWQIPIKTNSRHGIASIKSINTKIILELLSKDITPVITGFQGIDEQNRITTIGRGGSDTTAVAIAAAVNADLCQIFTDVDGIYRCDPKIINNQNTNPIPCLSYKQAMLLSTRNIKIIHNEAVRIALNNNVKVKILTPDSKTRGTFIMSNNEEKNYDYLFEDKIIKNMLFTKPMYLIEIDCSTLKEVLKYTESNDINIISYSDKKTVLLINPAALKAVKDLINDNDIISNNAVMTSIIGSFDNELYSKILDIISENNINLYFLSSSDKCTISLIIEHTQHILLKEKLDLHLEQMYNQKENKEEKV
ncbi:hypothetical protein GUI12_01615 [Anaplasmataceae bacterium AB001_6]|nr:hypothetical protein GUI12_01615 [Anaplasmataceae bacterium AB001_6]